jgi:hypothetical protein
MTIAKADKLRASLYGKSVQLDPIGGGKSHNDDTIGETLEKVIEYETKANKLIDSLINARLEIEKAIASVPDYVQREVLERRYLLYQDWESHYNTKTGEYIKGIGEEMNYSDRQIYRIHGQALLNVSVNVSKLSGIVIS